jgi:hypothetical protein
MDTTIIIVIIAALVIIAVVFLLRDRITELFVDGKKATMQVKAKADEPVVEDEPSPGVVFKGNTIRGEGEYRMRDAEFSENDVDGKQKIELGYDEPSKDSLDQENP